MIGKLQGKIEHVNIDTVIVNVGGVGYQISCPKRTSLLLKINQEAIFFVHTQMKESAIELFGFEDMHTKDMFLLLQSVNGVGAKMALSILDAYATEKIQNIILLQQKEMLTRISGIGNKVAQRLILELTEKIKKITPINICSDSLATPSHKNSEEALLALVKLGIANNEAKKQIEKVVQSSKDELSTQEIITLVLQNKTN